jgi:Domain of unknown function (DUF4347)
MAGGNLAINALNLVDPDVKNIEIALKNKGNQIIFTYGGMSNGVGQMVADVLNVASLRSILVLRIWSHGSSGGQAVSVAPRINPKGQRAGIGITNFNDIQGDLARLAPCFTEGGRFELRGCNVAVGSTGEGLLKALARLLQVDVYAQGREPADRSTGLDRPGSTRHA